jgi:hypothetical protein
MLLSDRADERTTAYEYTGKKKAQALFDISRPRTGQPDLAHG